MITEQGRTEFQRHTEALAGLRPVPDDIAQAHDLVDLLLLDIRKNGSQGYQIAVDI
jgi:hypothetical protein